MDAKEIEALENAASRIMTREINKPDGFELDALQLAEAIPDLLKQHEGKVLVPVEPSEEMTEAGAAITSGWDIPFGCVDIYKAMILANTKEGKANDC